MAAPQQQRVVIWRVEGEKLRLLQSVSLTALLFRYPRRKAQARGRGEDPESQPCPLCLTISLQRPWYCPQLSKAGTAINS